MNTPTQRKRLYPGDHVCLECGSAFRPQIHHVLARCMGGNDTMANKVVLCRECHVKLHSESGHFRGWGSIGGTNTQANMESRIKALANLRQFKGWSRERLEKYVIARALA